MASRVREREKRMGNESGRREGGRGGIIGSEEKRRWEREMEWKSGCGTKVNYQKFRERK